MFSRRSKAGRRRLAGPFHLLLLAALLVLAALAATAAGPGSPAPWAVDPEDPGEDLPPAGRSLFDSLVTIERGGQRVYDVPFPFANLVRAVTDLAPSERVLIPLGRSLQRNAAAPRFFSAPRAVLAVTGDSGRPPRPDMPLLKDRLYIGYQETAAILEVISYNETAGRFEFQVVRDYRPGSQPRVLYASRALCTACHQNAAPIFARQLWDETNANPRIAGLLRDEKRDFYGFPVDLGPDAPYAVQAAADRANRFALDQRLWREGCEAAREQAPRCRAALFTAALQYRLGSRFDETRLTPFAPIIKERFPRGLAVPDPDLPNRDPFAGPVSGPRQASVPGSLDPEQTTLLGGVVLHSSIPAVFEPLNPRPPLETWSLDGGFERLVSGLAAFLAERDVRDLDARLRAAAPASPRRRLAADCRLVPRRSAAGEIDRLKLECQSGQGDFTLQGRLYLAAGRVTGGEIESVTIGGAAELADLAVESREPVAGVIHLTLLQKGSGLRARRPNGDAVERLDLAWRDSGAATLNGRAELTFLSDFAAVDRVVDAMVRSTAAGESDAFADRPFRRSALVPALLAQLGAAPANPPSTAGMPQAMLDALSGGAGGAGPEAAEAERLAARFPEPALRTFFRYCATCHATDQPSPPNFLHGEPAEVRGHLAQCAERIYFRLGMWQLAREDRPKTAMPPVHALRRLHLDPAAWPDDPDLLLLRQHAADLLRAQTGTAPKLEELTARGYENLRGCLPAATAGANR
ncbi:MAG TPA: hypothetical protein VH988_21970 [Thermoanaerobaculia bacterium]|jgi:hypothetical protein|nr:hypothetical protein [Thermoanaerobaculia bacterium]